MNQHSSNNDPASLVKNYLSSPTQVGGLNAGDSLSQTLVYAVQTIKKNRWLIALFLILGVVGGIIKALSETPVYQAGLTMVVEPSGDAYRRQGVFDPYAFRFYETQYELLKSRSVACLLYTSPSPRDRG